ncbi:hypothetical protein PIB30_076962 [Stylosanthes scabra]|uniref:Uncharacterized protein n=1 Tax=Stylosanthes scabra TaxID=79078 RepID=A0ABU6QQT6_9FABA|nr:hypothetical protein [Stylosanthes scabra]
MGIPHFLAIPFLIPGHINPLIQLSNVLAKHGCKVTFLNTEYNYKRMKKAVAATAQANNIDDHDEESSTMIRFVTLPDGLDPEDDRNNVRKMLGYMKKTVPALLPNLIQDINSLDSENKISCILVTFNMSCVLEVGHKLGIKCAALFPFSATGLVSLQFIRKLIHDGIIDSDVGMELENDENGFISKEEILKKVEQLLADESIRERSSKLKEATRKNLSEGGQSSINIEKFVNWAKH